MTRDQLMAKIQGSRVLQSLFTDDDSRWMDDKDGPVSTLSVDDFLKVPNQQELEKVINQIIGFEQEADTVKIKIEAATRQLRVDFSEINERQRQVVEKFYEMRNAVV